MITVTGLRANFLISVGALSAERVARVAGSLEGFSEAGNSPIGRMFFNPAIDIVVFLAEGQVTVGTNGPPTESVVENMRKVGTNAFSALMLDASSVQLVVNGTALISDEREITALQRSLTWAPPDSTASRLATKLKASAMGLRFITKNDTFNGEIKVEPFLRQANMYYVEMERMSTPSVGLEAAWDLVQAEFDGFQSSILPAIADSLR